jgi:hypothetical protein
MYVRMPWGKFKGLPLTEIEGGYLQWALYDASAAQPWLKAAIREELARREQEETTPQSHAVLDLRSVVKTWFAGLARDYHPDRRGGDGREMKLLNEAHERLKKLAGIC